MIWVAFWLVWTIGGFVMFGLVACARSHMVDPVPPHWTATHMALFIVAGGPVIWVLTALVLAGFYE